MIKKLETLLDTTYNVHIHAQVVSINPSRELLYSVGIERLQGVFRQEGKVYNRSSAIALTQHYKKLILFNESFIKQERYYISNEDIIDTMLHEIAHVFDYVFFGNRGHGETWKSFCTDIGAKPFAKKSLKRIT